MIQTLNFETLSIRNAIERNDGVTAHEAKICPITCKNRAFKQKAQNT
jgi:hypothetical protein